MSQQTLVMEIPTPTSGTKVLIKGRLDDYGEGEISIDINNFTRIRIPITDEQESQLIEQTNTEGFDRFWDSVIEVEAVVDTKGNLEFKSLKLAE